MNAIKEVVKKISGSLKTKIMFWFVIISFIPISIFLIFSLALIQNDAEKEIKTRLESAKNVVLQEIERLCKHSLDYSILISNNPQLREAVAKKDHLKVVQIISPLASELSIHQIVITDGKGTLIGRSDILSKYGDNMKDDYLVKCGLARLKHTSVQCENGTVYIKSVSDIVSQMSANNMRVIGTIIVGYKLDKKFVENLTQLTKMDITVFPKDLSKTISSSSNRNVIDNNNLKMAFSGQYEYIAASAQRGNYRYILIPIRKSEKTDVAGVLALISTNAIASSFIKSSLRFSIILLIVTLIVIITVSLFVSNRITRPIIKLAESAKKIASGSFDIQIKVDNDANDEIALLTQEFSRMVKNIYTYATNIEQTLSTTQQYIDRLNKIASESSKTSKITSEQIKEIIALAENQKIVFEQTTQMVCDLENQIQKMFEIFKMIQNEASMVYATTSKEQESIKKLINHMYTVNSAIIEVAMDLKKAIDDFRSIARMSQNISSLAERIKIIALNASIEAAKRNIPTFEVIASEISRLSQSANHLAKSSVESIETGLSAFERTNRKLENVLSVVESGAEVAKRSSESLSKIEMSNQHIKTKIEDVINKVASQQEKIFNINNVLKNQTQSISQYFKMLISIRDIFQNQKKAVDKLIDQFSDVHEGIVKLASISMGTDDKV
ncbi:methyl-accepting chemotaxis protein [Caldicellulosiruptor bescii]|uniref:Methyl-accepting chemotaxis sensory transducer n=2 Tax=Caldicellulosiruptor bescii TaxID=31899 RepID=B9MQD9_CALBD|nr:methyl-accepting chemotaxis protein [Caldicellulosiruptor bescii]ACM61796.1 methyl-accepting chemotaxis sensory transducer [Caldicellulosiruptor bescii DSM 6725]PBC88405.1 methyl-accepting chemotaxis protein [Caldicellulosiruptor bescii]PBC92114.1 methyl-accepting chemotaxis protein [Caldicellulosiruptor bescii]PBD05076.1 methyl-accepting chemotaxis protein [Caldicellulosiruptor bescii]PBD05293.1 methyl-accepting chemotaxis protein [Caldicellulosiruptor bescii]